MLNHICGRGVLLDHLEHNLRCFLSVTAPPWLDQLRYPWTRKIRQARLAPPKQMFGCLPKSISRQIETDWLSIASSMSVDANRLSKYLATNYQLYLDYPCDCSKSATCSKYEYSTMVRQDTSGDIVVRIRESLDPIKQDLTLALLHGSLASDDFILGYSDIDISLWIDKAICLDPERLLDFRNRLVRCSHSVYTADYVQHHEYFVASGFNLESRDGIMFPDVLMDEGVSLFSKHNIESAARNNQTQLLEQALEKNLNRIESGLQNKRFNNWYQVKCLLSHISITPTLYYQAKNLRLNKKQAVETMCREYPQETLALKLTTHLRKKWPDHGYNCPGRLYRASLKINPNLIRILVGMRLPTPGYIKTQLDDRFQGQAYRFTEFIRGMLKSDI